MDSIDTHQGLTWSLVIATYKREHILPKCLKLAAEQTWPPKDIVVIDASPNWVSVKESITKDFEQNHPAIPLVYTKAKFASSSAQRNQGVDLATGDIVFLFDDDSLMYPDCAENVMQVYEADTECAIAGVSARSVPVPPPNVQDTTIEELKEKKFIPQKHPQTKKLSKLANAWLGQVRPICHL